MTEFYRTNGAFIIVPDAELVAQCQEILIAMNAPIPKVRKIDNFWLFCFLLYTFSLLSTWNTNYIFGAIVSVLIFAYLEKVND